MIYITGDTHGNFNRIVDFCNKYNTTVDDVLIILGDSGINYYGGIKDKKLKEQLYKLPITLFCIHGNHENRPENISSYIAKQWHVGFVLYEEEYPNILFAIDGEIYVLNDKMYMAIGGAYSVDKYYRLECGYGWWKDEQPSEKIKSKVEGTLKFLNWKVHGVLSHTCPIAYEPREVFLSFIDQSTVDKSTEMWLSNLEFKLKYDKWYCGHYHTDKIIDKLRFLFNDIVELQ